MEPEINNGECDLCYGMISVDDANDANANNETFISHAMSLTLVRELCRRRNSTASQKLSGREYKGHNEGTPM